MKRKPALIFSQSFLHSNWIRQEIWFIVRAVYFGFFLLFISFPKQSRVDKRDPSSSIADENSLGNLFITLLFDNHIKIALSLWPINLSQFVPNRERIPNARMLRWEGSETKAPSCWILKIHPSATVSMGPWERNVWLAKFFVKIQLRLVGKDFRSSENLKVLWKAVFSWKDQSENFWAFKNFDESLFRSFEVENTKKLINTMWNLNGGQLVLIQIGK